MTRIAHHNGQNPLPGSNIVAIALAIFAAVYAAAALTPDQFGQLATVLGIPGTILGLAGAIKKP